MCVYDDNANHSGNIHKTMIGGSRLQVEAATPPPPIAL